MSERYIVKYAADAVDLGWDHFGRDDVWVLYDTTNEPPTPIDSDGGEPEDQSLVRDWRWVPAMLNEQAAEIAALEARLAEAEQAKVTAIGQAFRYGANKAWRQDYARSARKYQGIGPNDEPKWATSCEAEEVLDLRDKLAEAERERDVNQAALREAADAFVAKDEERMRLILCDMNATTRAYNLHAAIRAERDALKADLAQANDNVQSLALQLEADDCGHPVFGDADFAECGGEKACVYCERDALRREVAALEGALAPALDQARAKGRDDVREMVRKGAGWCGRDDAAAATCAEMTRRLLERIDEEAAIRGPAETEEGDPAS